MVGRFDIRDEQGFVLPAVLAAMALITALAIGGYALSRQSLAESIRIGSEQRAYQAASSGLERELSTFSETKFNSGAYPSPPVLINGSDSYRISVNKLADGFYEMVSLGVSTETSETVRVRFQHFDLWDMNIAGAENSQVGSGAGFNGNGRIVGKVYVNGDFDWSGNGSLEDGPVFVRDGVFNKQSSGSNVGLSSDPVDMYLDNAPTGNLSNMYTTIRGAAPRIEVPWLTEADITNYLNLAKNQSTAKVRQGSAAPGADSTYYKWITGDLTIDSTSFGYGPALANSAVPAPDDFAYDAATGTLRVQDVVFVDGLLTIGPNVARYYGKGVIVARDGIVINGHLIPAAANQATMSYWDSYGPRVGTDYCLGLLTPEGVTMNSTGWGMVGAIFSNGPFTATSTGAKYRGSMISGGIDFQQPNCELVTQPGLRGYLPSAMPALDGITARGDWVRQ